MRETDGSDGHRATAAIYRMSVNPFVFSAEAVIGWRWQAPAATNRADEEMTSEACP